MFNQRTKSKTADSMPNATSNTSSATASVSSASKGLLSFNTSNFTKLFKNSTNFVQSTFGSSSPSQSQSQSPPIVNNSSTEVTEQSFTIPSIKKRNDASNSGATKKQQRDILSTPVLIQPVSITNASSPLANLSSYKKITNDDCKSNGNSTTMPQAYKANGSQKAHKPSMPVANNVTVTISPASNQQPSSLSHAQNSLTNTITTSATKHQTDTQQKIPQTTDAKLQNQQNVSDNNTSTLATLKCSPAAKKMNANILFETVKMSKQQPNAISTPSTSTSTRATSQSSLIPSHDSLEYSKNSTISSVNHIKSSITKNDMDKNINNEPNAYEKTSSIQNVMDNELIDGRHLERNRESANVALSNNRMKAISMNVIPQISSASKHFSTTNVLESTKPSNVLDSASNQQSIQQQKYYQQINDNGMNVFALPKNNNSIEIDALNNDDVDISANIMCNNNLDYSFNECMRQMNNTNDNPFKLTVNKFSPVELLAQATAENSKTVENIYANCVMMPIKSVNLDNYQQQDTNENVIAAGEIDALSIIEAADGPNNNYNRDEIYLNTDSSNACNNNASNSIDELNISNIDSATDIAITTTTTFISTHTTSDSVGKINQSGSLSNFNQNCFIPKSYEMYDILEESDDEDRTSLFRFNRWNSSCSLFVPKSNVNSVSSSSFAAAIAFANEMDSTNRNPFLQLIAVSPTGIATETQTITTTSTKSPIVVTCSESQLFFERQKNSIGIAAPLISSAFNNNDQSDVSMAFTSTDKCLTSSTLSISNCASAWNEFAMQATTFLPPPSPPPNESSSQINGFIEQNDFQLNAISNSNATAGDAKNHISSDVMDTMLLFLKEHGNQYIKQFMQVI